MLILLFKLIYEKIYNGDFDYKKKVFILHLRKSLPPSKEPGLDFHKTGKMIILCVENFFTQK